MTRYEAIFRRKSVRKYRDDAVEEQILERIRDFGREALEIRSGICMKWKIYRASDHKVRGMFQVKAPYYAALYAEDCEDSYIQAGCLMQQVVLYLHTQGIGSCYQGGARLKEEEESGNMKLMMILAFGYPAESLERTRSEFKRAEPGELVKASVPPGKAQKKLLESARLAPSALNQQPWRFVVTENRIHLFTRRPGKIGYERQYGKYMFHAGIVLSHMLLTAEEYWFDLEYRKLDSIMEKAIQNYLYAGSVIIANGSMKT